jgi:RNA polymerase sigma factor (sigma-70 family)
MKSRAIGAEPSMRDPDSTEALVAEAQRGDRAAFGGIYEKFAASVLGYLRGLHVPDPEDTLGEVFVSVVRDIRSFEGDETQFRSWIFTIAHRRAMDAHRDRARRREDPTDPEGLPDGTDPFDLADAVTDRIGLGARAFEAVDLLTEDQRAVVLLRIVADLSVADTAVVLGKRPGAVKTLQRRALAALRRSLIVIAVVNMAALGSHGGASA